MPVKSLAKHRDEEMGVDEIERSDAALVTAVRAGDEAAYGELWSRHEAAARRLARQISNPSNADDLVSESFLKVLRVLKDGGGPDGAFRPYLFSTLRRINIDNGRSYYQRVSLTQHDSDLETDASPSAADVAHGLAENSAAWRAWNSLPDSSRTLLWHLVIEEETPAQIAPLIGTTPNGVSSRAVRAKERLRQAFLQQHVLDADNEQCRRTRSRLGEYIRNALSARDRAEVQAHLDDCDRCRAALLDVTDVNQTLRAFIAPIILGGSLVAGKYLASGGALKAAAGFGWLHGVRHAGLTKLVGTAAAGVLVVAGATTAIVLTGSHGKQPLAESPGPVATTTTSSSSPSSPATAVSPTSPSPSRPARKAATARTTLTVTAPGPVVIVAPNSPPRPSRTRHATSGAAPTSTPPASSSAPAPPPPPATTTLSQADHYAQVGSAPVGPGTYSVAAPSSWRITAIAMSAPAGTAAAHLPTCSTTGSRGACTIPDPAANTVYWVSLTVTGPASDHTSTLTVRYGDQSGTPPSTSTPLVNPVLTQGTGTGAALIASSTAAEDDGAYTVDVPIASGWTLDDVSLTSSTAGVTPVACTRSTPIEWSCSNLVDGASYTVVVTGAGPSGAPTSATVSYAPAGATPTQAQTFPLS